MNQIVILKILVDRDLFWKFDLRSWNLPTRFAIFLDIVTVINFLSCMIVNALLRTKVKTHMHRKGMDDSPAFWWTNEYVCDHYYRDARHYESINLPNSCRTSRFDSWRWAVRSAPCTSRSCCRSAWSGSPRMALNVTLGPMGPVISVHEDRK